MKIRDIQNQELQKLSRFEKNQLITYTPFGGQKQQKRGHDF